MTGFLKPGIKWTAIAIWFDISDRLIGGPLGFAASRSGPWPVCPEADKLLRLFQDDFELG
jgi:hypothetical protein